MEGYTVSVSVYCMYVHVGLPCLEPPKDVYPKVR